MGRPLRRPSYVTTSSSNDVRGEERLEEHCLTFEDLNGARIGVGRNLALGAKLNPVPLWGGKLRENIGILPIAILLCYIFS